MRCIRIAPAGRIAGAVMVLGLLLLPTTIAAAYGREASGSKRLLIPFAGWHGRDIREPHSHDSVPASIADRPLGGWSAGPVSIGTGTHRPSGSQRVREVQRRLRALGYRPGPVDGIFGRRTRAAVGWFQVKHGFPVDGRATLAVVRHLRARTTHGPGSGRAGAANRRVEARVGRRGGSQSRSWEAYRALAGSMPAAGAAQDDAGPGWRLAGLLVLAFAVGYGAVALRQRERTAPVAARALPAPRKARAVGYMRVSERRLEARAAALEARCADHGITLARLVSDADDDDRAGSQRPGLAFALAQLEAGEADCLAVCRVGELTPSPHELASLLNTMSERATPLLVLNAGPANAGRRSGRSERSMAASAAASPQESRDG